MNKQDFPSCCAISLLTEFGSTSSAAYSNKIPNNEIIKFIEDSKIVYNFKDENGLEHIGISKRIQLIILNSEQLNSIGKELFLNLGFTITPLGYYPCHGNNIFMLHYNPNENGNKLK